MQGVARPQSDDQSPVILSGKNGWNESKADLRLDLVAIVTLKLGIREKGADRPGLDDAAQPALHILAGIENPVHLLRGGEVYVGTSEQGAKIPAWRNKPARSKVQTLPANIIFLPGDRLTRTRATAIPSRRSKEASTRRVTSDPRRGSTRKPVRTDPVIAPRVLAA